jgi:hypothetical protein
VFVQQEFQGQSREFLKILESRESLVRGPPEVPTQLL